MLRTRHALAAFAAILVAGSAPAQNMLVNGGFETNPPSTLGNHVAYSIAPWALGPSGQTSNVVTVNGGTSYGSLGPRLDADPTTPAGVNQHYLDIAGGENDFYQSFTPVCNDTVTFGGYFSTRDNQAASASVRIVQGNGLGGTVVGATNLVNLPAGNSMDDPWTLVSYTAVLNANTPYTLVVHMNNPTNFDEGFVRYKTECGTAVPHDSTSVNPCCPPWNVAQMQSVMSYVGTGGIKGNYSLRFEGPATAAQNTTLNTQLAAYLAYAHSMNVAITQLQIVFTVFDAGVLAMPVTVGFGSLPFTVTWSPAMSGPLVFPSTLFQINRWYTIRSRIRLTGPQGEQKFFPDECATVEMYVRLQVLP